jgi:hypothetical protein
MRWQLVQWVALLRELCAFESGPGEICAAVGSSNRGGDGKKKDDAARPAHRAHLKRLAVVGPVRILVLPWQLSPRAGILTIGRLRKMYYIESRNA